MVFAGFSFAKAVASDRSSSEDRAEVILRGDDFVVVLADGAGGLRGGGTASDAIVGAVREGLANASLDPTDVRALSGMLCTVDAELAKRMAGETTAVVVSVGAYGVVGVSAGDSEGWIVSADRIEALTNAQNRSRLGSGRASPVGFHRPHLDGALVVATDGLFKYANPDAIAMACRGRSVEEASARLIALPKLRSGGYPDDVAVVVATSNGT